mmetsp:Transcript_47051/g.154080  ORF Transcript_47051/g.154080 Transcript_47051/m.154080 type:complete len:240 (+) Transcript_47051:30-749(+)
MLFYITSHSPLQPARSQLTSSTSSGSFVHSIVAPNRNDLTAQPHRLLSAQYSDPPGARASVRPGAYPEPEAVCGTRQHNPTKASGSAAARSRWRAPPRSLVGPPRPQRPQRPHALHLINHRWRLPGAPRGSLCEQKVGPLGDEVLYHRPDGAVGAERVGSERLVGRGVRLLCLEPLDDSVVVVGDAVGRHGRLPHQAARDRAEEVVRHIVAAVHVLRHGDRRRPRLCLPLAARRGVGIH